MMPVSKAQQRAAAKWDAENLRRFSLAVPIELGERIKAAADAAGLSVNAYIRRAVEQALDQE